MAFSESVQMQCWNTCIDAHRFKIDFLEMHSACVQKRIQTHHHTATLEHSGPSERTAHVCEFNCYTSTSSTRLIILCAFDGSGERRTRLTRRTTNWVNESPELLCVRQLPPHTLKCIKWVAAPRVGAAACKPRCWHWPQRDQYAQVERRRRHNGISCPQKRAASRYCTLYLYLCTLNRFSVLLEYDQKMELYISILSWVKLLSFVFFILTPAALISLHSFFFISLHNGQRQINNNYRKFMKLRLN